MKKTVRGHIWYNNVMMTDIYKVKYNIMMIPRILKYIVLHQDTENKKT